MPRWMRRRQSQADSRPKPTRAPGAYRTPPESTGAGRQVTRRRQTALTRRTEPPRARQSAPPTPPDRRSRRKNQPENHRASPRPRAAPRESGSAAAAPRAMEMWFQIVRALIALILLNTYIEIENGPPQEKFT